MQNTGVYVGFFTRSVLKHLCVNV